MKRLIIKGFRNEYGFLSNFHNATIEFNGLIYLNNEAAFQAQKCLARSHDFCGLSTVDAKRLGKKVTLRSDWEVIKDKIMYDVCCAKFTQHKSLQEKLIALNNAVLLEENTWGDTYWGVVYGKGQNRLGEILMQISEEMSSFKVIIAGGRDFENYDMLKKKCDKILINVNKPIIVVCGKAKGADSLGERYAKERGYAVKEFKPDWDKYGKRAGILRNKDMLLYADAAICFWDKKSRGTKNMIDISNEHKLPLRVIYY